MVEFVDGDKHRIDDCDSSDNSKFEFELKDGIHFKVNRVHLVYRKTILKQLAEQREVKFKFCLRDDYDAQEEDDDTENWEMVIFPMYRKDEEIQHDTMVRQVDSAVNGNVYVEDGKVYYWASNYCLPEYEEIQDEVVNYAKKYIECFLEENL